MVKTGGVLLFLQVATVGTAIWFSTQEKVFEMELSWALMDFSLPKLENLSNNRAHLVSHRFSANSFANRDFKFLDSGPEVMKCSHLS